MRRRLVELLKGCSGMEMSDESIVLLLFRLLGIELDSDLSAANLGTGVRYIIFGDKVRCTHSAAISRYRTLSFSYFDLTMSRSSSMFSIPPSYSLLDLAAYVVIC